MDGTPDCASHAPCAMLTSLAPGAEPPLPRLHASSCRPVSLSGCTLFEGREGEGEEGGGEGEGARRGRTCGGHGRPNACGWLHSALPPPVWLVASTRVSRLHTLFCCLPPAASVLAALRWGVEGPLAPVYVVAAEGVIERVGALMRTLAAQGERGSDRPGWIGGPVAWAPLGLLYGYLTGMAGLPERCCANITAVEPLIFSLTFHTQISAPLPPLSSPPAPTPLSPKVRSPACFGFCGCCCLLVRARCLSATVDHRCFWSFHSSRRGMGLGRHHPAASGQPCPHARPSSAATPVGRWPVVALPALDGGPRAPRPRGRAAGLPRGRVPPGCPSAVACGRHAAARVGQPGVRAALCGWSPSGKSARPAE